MTLFVLVVVFYSFFFLLFFAFIEKWAKCYRHIQHWSTDTNMYVERYKKL